jgi:cell division protease FtsH
MESDSSSRKQTIVIGYIIAAFIGVVALQWVITTSSTVETIPYSEFEQLVDQGKLTEVAIGQDTIQGKLKDSRTENWMRWGAAASEV